MPTESCSKHKKRGAGVSVSCAQSAPGAAAALKPIANKKSCFMA
jgi:hypothetical protein